MNPAAYTAAKATRETLEKDVRETTAVLDAFPKGAMNLTTDAAKATPEWTTARAASQHAMSVLRQFNAWFVGAFKCEIAAERKERRK